MKLELNGAGRIVIRNITPDAFGYLEGERQKLYDPHGYWYFGCRIFGDSLYVDDCIGSAEVKRHHIDVLVDNDVDHCVAAQNAGVSAVLAAGRHCKDRLNEVAFSASDWEGIERCVAEIARRKGLV